MTRTKIISSRETCILAIEALDNLVNDLLKASHSKPAPGFLDWVADEATPLVEMSVSRSFDNPRFVNSLQMGHPKIALAHWVRHWVRPLIAIKFSEMNAHFPEFPADSFNAPKTPAPRQADYAQGGGYLPGLNKRPKRETAVHG